MARKIKRCDQKYLVEKFWRARDLKCSLSQRSLEYQCYVIPRCSGLFFKDRMPNTTTDHMAETLQNFIPGQINLIWGSAWKSTDESGLKTVSVGIQWDLPWGGLQLHTGLGEAWKEGGSIKTSEEQRKVMSGKWPSKESQEGLFLQAFILWTTRKAVFTIQF